MVGKFRGWHIVAGIAAMVLSYVLGTAMGLNNTATFMSSCVAFVAVSLWTDSRISRRRRETAREAARRDAARGSGAGLGAGAAGSGAGREAESATEREADHGPYRDPF
jgi:uncharacterized membrane protein YfcA